MSGGITTCGYFQPPAGVPADFAPYAPSAGWGAGGQTYTFPSNATGHVIYVEGGARFNDVNLDGASVIVDGPLTVTGSRSGMDLTLNVPATAPLEYPYYASQGLPPSWPCSAQAGGTCDSSAGGVFSGTAHGLVQFRGFLYVKGFMYVGNAIAPIPDWNMAGVLVVGNQQSSVTSNGLGANLGLTFGTLTVAYDDTINHNIQVNPITPTGAIRLEPDQIQFIPAP